MSTLHNFRRSLFVIFLLAYLPAKAQYCTINFSSGVEPITLVDFGSINNATPNTIPGGAALEDFTALSTFAVQGQTYTITVKSNTDGAYSNYVRVFIDWNQNSDFTDPGESFDIGTIYNSTGLDAVQATGNILIPFGALVGNTRMRVTAKYGAYGGSCNTAGWGQAEDYTLNVLAGNSCTGTPVAGTATAPANICPNTAFTLSSTGYTAASGIDFQWQEDAGSGWQPIAGATDPNYAITSGITVSTSYQLTITCVNGGATDVSNTVAVAVNLPTQCYCSIAFPSTGAGPISFVSFSNISNTTAATVNSGQYEDFTAQTATIMQGATYPITVKGNTVGAYSDYIRVFIDWDQNGSFSDPGESYDIGILYNSTGTDAIEVTSNIFVPTTVPTGTTRMRVTKKWNAYATPCNTAGYGQAEDYTLDVLPSNSCLGTPTAGTASAPASTCPNTAFNLSLTGQTIAAGIDIQWEYFDGSSWQPVLGANTSTFQVPGITSSTDYRATVTCSNGGSQASSNIVTVGITPFQNCYCIPTNSGGVPITNITIQGTTLSNTTGPAAGPTYYIAYPATGSTTASLMQGVAYDLSATFGTAAIASLWIDFNQDGIFDGSEWTQITTNATAATATFTVPAGALTGTTGMRVRSRGTGTQNGAGDACIAMGGGETEDYLVTVIPSISCTGNPSAGTASGPSSVCSGSSFVIGSTGYTVATGISMQWEYNDGSGWNPVSGATSPTYTATGGITTATDYHLIVTCANGGNSASSNTVSITINPASQCYCPITFTSGVEPITLVDFAGINNPSSDTIGLPPQSEDFTSITGNVAQGQSYPIAVKGNTDGPYTDYIRVFIDWNQNGSYSDPGESFDLGTILNSTGLDAIQATSNIAVPATALTGTTRMRITKKWNAYSTACNTTGYGQAENYSLIISFPLSISLSDITALNAGSVNRINWSTGSEEQDDHFELERSADGISFTTRTYVQANGRASAYGYLDETPLPGMNYYRLKMVSASGKAGYSKTVTAEVKTKGAFVVQAYPNPVKDRLTINIYGSPAGHARIIISDLMGKQVGQKDITGNKAEILMDNVAPGTYLVRYSDDNQTRTIKINKL